ncbi:MAG: peptidoglycan DD-metalloendopeptidase family protein [Acidobacteria bacterium]|nr:peptidoglycan DD-metalloendopeptidase family protein [Acidobacteriota bacterium]
MSDYSPIVPLNQVPLEFLTSSGSRIEGRIHAAKSEAAGPKQRSEIRKAAQQFEAVFIANMLKVMRETIEESGLLEGGFGKSIYTELFDQEVSLSLAKRGVLGIADLLERNILENLSARSKEETDPSPAENPSCAPETPSQASPAGSGKTGDPGLEISDLQLPVHGQISSHYGMRRDPFSGRPKFHKGLDLAAPAGMCVVPALPGKVISAGYENGYGNTVLVQHDGGLQTRYGHLGSIYVSIGQTITSEDALGTVGSTGRSTGPHLHFEVIRDGEQVNPAMSLGLYDGVPGPRPKS